MLCTVRRGLALRQRLHQRNLQNTKTCSEPTTVIFAQHVSKKYDKHRAANSNKQFTCIFLLVPIGYARLK